MRVILGSASPRRKDILDAAGIDCEIIVSDCEEVISGTKPADIVSELSMQKAEDVFFKVCDRVKKGELPSDEYIIIGADTIVAFGERIFGKPKDRMDAISMLDSLSGCTHQVYTGVTLVVIHKHRFEKPDYGAVEYGIDAAAKMSDTASDTIFSFVAKTDVSMYSISREEIEAYVDSGEPMDKAGAYAIQGGCAKYIASINGEYNNVVGLPIARIINELKKADIDLLSPCK